MRWLFGFVGLVLCVVEIRFSLLQASLQQLYDLTR